MSTPAFVIKHVGCDDSKPWAVVTSGQAFEGKWKRNVLFVHHWYEKEDDARADAHRTNYPDY